MSSTQQIPGEHAQALGPFTKRMTIRKRVASACLFCKKSRVRCDDQRPCKRCVHFGKEIACAQESRSSKTEDQAWTGSPIKDQGYRNILVSGQEGARLNDSDSVSNTVPATFFEQQPILGNAPTEFDRNFFDQPKLFQEARANIQAPLFAQNISQASIRPPSLPPGVADFAHSTSSFAHKPPVPTQAEILQHLVARQRQEIMATLAHMAHAAPVLQAQSPLPMPIAGPICPTLSPAHAAAIAAFLHSGAGVPPPPPPPQSFPPPPPSFPRFF
jgi:hypothetical protein